MSTNLQILIGHIGGEVKFRTFDNGGAVANCSVATSERWTDKSSGERKEETTWHNLVFRGKLADVAQQYLRKGSHIYVQGRTKHRKYTKDGVEQSITEVVVDTLNILTPKSSGDSEESQPSRSNQSSARPAAAKQPASKQADIDDDDIPF